MKGHMEQFVDQLETTMFDNACQEVRNHLKNLCNEVRTMTLDRVETVFSAMKRDYLLLIGGIQLAQEKLPRGERTAKRELDEVITLTDEEFKRVVETELEDFQADGQDGEAGDEEMVEGDVDELEFEDDPKEQDEGDEEEEDLSELADEMSDFEDGE